MDQTDKIDITNLDFEELDDKEFEIPKVDTLPTLESILNEPDESVSIESDDLDLSCSGLAELLNDETSSLGSIDSKGVRRQHLNTYLRPNIVHGSILKYKPLSKVSSHMTLYQYGNPTCITVSTSFIVIGTFNGYLLVFDLKQNIKWCLFDGRDLGSVSAVTVRQDNLRLLCGYVKGGITLWNLQNGELINVFNELHGAQTAVLQLKFLSDPSKALLSDSSGSVFILHVKKTNIESQCVFSGSRGEVLTVEPLILPAKDKKQLSEFNHICLIAMATVTKVVVMTLYPSMSIQFNFSLKGNADTLPLLAWQLVVIQISEDSCVIEPVLSFGRQNQIFFYQASLKSSHKIIFTPLMSIKLNYTIQSMAWLNPRVLITIDHLEKLHVIDVKSDEELEVVDIEDIKLVYGNAHYKALAIGGCVSPAMALAGERACVNSICICNPTSSNTSTGQLLILGLNSVYLFSIRKWNERIDLFLKENKFHEALAFGMTLYEDKAKAVVGLVGSKSDKRLIVSNKIVDILNLYVDVGLTKMCPEKGRIEVLFNFYKQMIPVCVEYCLAIDNQELLFEKFYDKFNSDAISKSIFLECLEPYILDGRLSKLQPAIAKELIIHYANKKYFQALEAIVTHLDIISLDIHLVMTLCWKHSMYDAIIYIHNQAFDDFISPLEELLDHLENVMSTDRELNENEINLGNKLLVYISCTLTGKAYHKKGTISFERKAQIRKDLLNFITKFKKNKPNDNSNETIYPYLKLLLNFDTNEFLNVLSIAFDEQDFDEDQVLIDQKQRIIDILLRIMVQNIGFTPSQIGSLFLFLARQIAKPKNSILVNKMLFNQVVEFLTNPKDDSRFEERQQALLELVQSQNSIQIEEERLLDLATKAKFYRICEFIYVKHKNWDKILFCYLDDPYRKNQVFLYIEQILDNILISKGEKQKFINQMFSQIEKLVEINKNKTAILVLDYVKDEKEIDSILKSIEDKPKTVYYLLHGFFVGSKTHKKDPSLSSINSLENAKDQKKQLFLAKNTLQEKFIELMCRFEPEYVISYLKQLEGYRDEVVLQACRQHNVKNAVSFLYEEVGNYTEAFKILHEDLTDLFEQMDKLLENSEEVDLKFDNLIDKIKTQLDVVINFCQRCSLKIGSSEEREKLWFSLLDKVLSVQYSLKTSERKELNEKYLSYLKELTNNLLSSMVGYIDLLTLLQRILQDPLFSNDKNAQLKDIKQLIMGMLDSFNYQQTLLQTTNNLIESDLHNQLYNLTKNASKAHSSPSTLCAMCMKDLIFDDDVVVFKCTHTFHLSCIGSKSKKTFKCHLCDSGSRRSNNKIFRRISEIAHNDQEMNSTRRNSNFSNQFTDRQLVAIETLRKCQRVESRVQILNQLSSSRQKFTGDKKDSFYQLKLEPEWKLNTE